MIRRFAQCSSTIVAVTLLVACAGPLPKIDLAPHALTTTKTITIIRAPEPKLYTVANFGHGGMAFGLIGGMIAAGDQASKQEQLSRLYKNNGVSVCSELSQKVADRLNGLGFSAKVEDAPWEEADGKHVLAFKKIESDADAVLVISPTIVGFVATGLVGGYDNDYLPTIATVVTVLGKDREKPIYRGYHVTGWQLKSEAWRYTPPSNRFRNFEALYTNPRASSRSLIEAASKVANSIGRDLKQQWESTK